MDLFLKPEKFWFGFYKTRFGPTLILLLSFYTRIWMLSDSCVWKPTQKCFFLEYQLKKPAISSILYYSQRKKGGGGGGDFDTLFSSLFIVLTFSTNGSLHLVLVHTFTRIFSSANKYQKLERSRSWISSLLYLVKRFTVTAAS